MIFYIPTTIRDSTTTAHILANYNWSFSKVTSGKKPLDGFIQVVADYRPVTIQATIDVFPIIF